MRQVGHLLKLKKRMMIMTDDNDIPVGDDNDSRRGQICNNCKGKSVPLQAWSGPEGSRKLRVPNFMTTAQGGGKVVSLRHRPHLPPGNSPGTHFC